MPNYIIKAITNLKHYNTMLSEEIEKEYVQIITRIKKDCANVFTQDQYANYFNISRRKFSDFINIKKYYPDILMQYGAINGYRVGLTCRKMNVR